MEWKICGDMTILNAFYRGNYIKFLLLFKDGLLNGSTLRRQRE